MSPGCAPKFRMTRMLGMLSIAQEQSRWQSALGRRFFTLLVLPEGSPLKGGDARDDNLD
jgi:hypothetical protein